MCEVSGRLLGRARLPGHGWAWMLGNAGGMPGLDHSCIVYSSSRKRGFVLLGVAGCDQWFSRQCNWMGLSSKKAGGFGPIFSAPGTRIQVVSAVLIWAQAGRV